MSPNGKQVPSEVSDELSARLASLMPPMPEALFTVSLDIGWGDCDPAQIAYTAQIPGWALKAIENWYRTVLGPGWYELNIDHDIGTPFVHLSLDFQSPITARAPLDCAVYVTKSGRTSIGHKVVGHQNGVQCFTCDTVAVFIEAKKFRPLVIPKVLRERISQYAAIHTWVSPHDARKD